MLQIWTLIFVSIGACLADVSSNYYCADMNSQMHIDIEQLMGMWYGIEIISHNAQGEHYVRVVPSCPILHLSEFRPHPPSTYSPLYKNYDYRYNYGERRDYNRRNNDRDRNLEYDYNQHGGRTTQSPYNRNFDRNYNRRYGQRNHNGFQNEMKRIRIWWDESGRATEYHLRYNVTRPGFWISSGPQNGSELEPMYSNFAGVVQVIKAVGNHLVLTFCHQLPGRQLFTIILSREITLDKTDIYGVHNLLNRRGLSTSAVKKVCSNGGKKNKIMTGLLVLVIIVFVS